MATFLSKFDECFGLIKVTLKFFVIGKTRQYISKNAKIMLKYEI